MPVIVTLAQDLIYEGLRYTNNKIVVTGFNEYNLQFGKIRIVVFRIKILYLVNRKMETLDFSVHFNAHEVLETEELSLSTITARKAILPKSWNIMEK